MHRRTTHNAHTNSTHTQHAAQKTGFVILKDLVWKCKTRNKDYGEISRDHLERTSQQCHFSFSSPSILHSASNGTRTPSSSCLPPAARSSSSLLAAFIPFRNLFSTCTSNTSLTVHDLSSSSSSSSLSPTLPTFLLFLH